jgi:twitching motility protein PilT
MPQIDQFLRLLLQKDGSDLHLSCGSAPVMRVHGDLQRVKFRELTPADMRTLVREILDEDQWAEYEQRRDLDFAYEIPGTARFRGNAFEQHRGPGAVFRIIPSEIPSADDLKLPEGGAQVHPSEQGAGRGDRAHRLREVHDARGHDRPDQPHADRSTSSRSRTRSSSSIRTARRWSISARWDAIPTASPAALKAALREDPDVILIGEMRDRETVSLALTAAETGHLVFGTLHTNSAHKTVDRILDTFPADQQDQVRAMLSESLKGVIAQQLLKRKGGGRVAAQEILVGTPAVGNLIREGKTYQIPSIIQTGKRDGMIQMDQSIMAHLMAGAIDGDEAYRRAHDKALFRQYVDGA